MKKRNVKLTRKKLTKEFADLYTYSLPHWRLQEICQKYLKKKWKLQLVALRAS